METSILEESYPFVDSCNSFSVIVVSSSLLVGFFLVSQHVNNRAVALPRTSYNVML